MSSGTGVLPSPRDGTLGGTPSGTPADAGQGSRENQRSLQRENETATTLAALGYRVEQRPERRSGDAHAPSKRPDLRLGGNIFDVYSPRTADLDTLRDTMSRKTKEQAGRLVINLADSPATPDQVRDVLARKPVPRLRELLVIDQQGRVSRLFPDPSLVA